MEWVKQTAFLAQQIQTGKMLKESDLASLKNTFQDGGRQANQIKGMIESLDVPQLKRMLYRKQTWESISTPPEITGKEILLYKAPLPGETQACIATDSLIARYLSWLARTPKHRAVVLSESDRHVVLFVPEGSKFDSIQSWQAFVEFVFSGQELVRTFIAMLNSIQLSERGFGVPEFPILSQDQQFIILSWFFRSAQSVEKRLKEREKKIRAFQSELDMLLTKAHDKSEKEIQKEHQKLKKEIQKLQETQNKELNKYSQNFVRCFLKFLEDEGGKIDEVKTYTAELASEKLKPAQRKKKQEKLNQLQQSIELTQEQLSAFEELFNRTNKNPLEFIKQFMVEHHQISKRIDILSDVFSEKAARQINLTRGDNFAKITLEIVRMVNRIECQTSNRIKACHTQQLELQPLLFENSQSLFQRLPGDGTGEFCYVCGRKVKPEEQFEANRFIFRSPSQRLQSIRGEKRPPVCRHCVAISFISPLKPTDQSVIIQLKPRSPNWGFAGEEVLGHFESFLRGLTLSQLDLAAGNYLMLTSEKVKVGKNWRYLSDVVGALVYAHFRLAELFDHATFIDYQAHIVAGISNIGLKSHRLAFLSILIKSLQLHLTEGSDVNHPVATAIRYVLADEPFLGLYELLSQPKIDPKREREIVRIEIEKSLEVWTNMMGNENRSKMIADIVALAGLLYPFVDQTRRQVKEKKDSKLDPDREASKLIEEVDEVFNFIYRFVDNAACSTVRLYRNPTNWFTYEQTKELLEKLSINVADRGEKKDEKGVSFLEVNSNDVEAAYRMFSQGDYKADADWRAFTYRLKLALYSRFPGLGVKSEKKDR